MTHRPLALITGATSGIGKEFALAFARRNFDLVLVARSEHALTEFAAACAERYGVDCIPLPIDLSVPEAGAQVANGIEKAAADRKVDVLVNNAGFGMYGEVVHQDRERALAQVRLNVLTLTDLTLRILPGMVERDHGTIINIASNAAFQPLPNMAIYGATKAYVKSFTEALWAEVHDTGVKVLAVCPGPTQTNFFNASGATVLGARAHRTASQVVEHAFRVLRQGRASFVDGVGNAIVARVLVRLVPTRVLLAGAKWFVGSTRQTVASREHA